MKKKLIRNLIIIIIAVVIIAAGYLAFMFLHYNRLPDRQYLEIQTAGDYSKIADSKILDSSEYYEIMTYNIGFGAYTADYDFFADGGKSSWAKDRESLMANICEIADVINYTAPDFVMLQEVDTDGTRTYHVNELELINRLISDYYYDFAVNYHSDFIFYPVYQPHGKNNAGIATYSSFEITEGQRRQLPLSDSTFDKLWDLDRCYSVSRVRVDNGKSLVLYNVHLSCYGSDASVRQKQLEMLFKDMSNEYKMGNYVICGGDFNHNLKLDNNGAPVPDWAADFPVDMIPSGFVLPIVDYLGQPNTEHDTCRNADKPYDPDTSFTVTADGFIVSDNVTVNYYANADWQYAYSDHDPVLMQFMLKPLLQQ
ncbi:MAG: endonuclease/exonuclease/phosphatase family protein [Lachnospiraceae bacterium]|nr:endonuclease/exonuclease/phosphatase family protein [Lachnospiraceae bacterium]